MKPSQIWISHCESTFGADAAFKSFYRAKGMTRISERVAYFQAKMGVESRSVKVIDLKHRWASCTPDGNLNFHWVLQGI